MNPMNVEFNALFKKAQESLDIKNAKREEKQKEYFLRVRARYESWEFNPLFPCHMLT
jgi:hypothetical protein